MEYKVKGESPKIDKEAFVHPEATVIGDVEIEDNSSVWPSASLRGDSNSIRIGSKTSVQDNAVIHTDESNPADIGNRVTIGHGAIVHGCTVEDEVLIGMGATVLSGAYIGKHSIIAAGAVVPEGKDIPKGSLVMGVPGKIVRELEESDVEHIRQNAQVYVDKLKEYKESMEEV